MHGSVIGLFSIWHCIKPKLDNVYPKITYCGILSWFGSHLKPIYVQLEGIATVLNKISQLPFKCKFY